MNTQIEKSQLNRLFGLDLIRTIAISLVLISHFAKAYEHVGFWGVELFFGLSGFLIGNILWRNFSKTADWGLQNVLNFWSRRWWRTLPNYYLFLGISIAFHYLLDQTLLPYKELINFFWFGQDFLNRSSNFYGVSWSLCIEEWFYLTFPLILYTFRKTGLTIKTSYLSSIFFIVLFCFLMRELLSRVADLHMITVARLDAVAIGVLTSFITSNFCLSNQHRYMLLFIGLILILSPIVFSYFLNLSKNSLINNKYTLLIVPLGSSLTLPYFKSLKQPSYRYFFFAISIKKISIWSYSIYLSHIPILFTVYYILGELRENLLGNIVSKIIGLILTIALSAFLYHFFELPFMNKRPQELNPIIK